MKTDESVDSAIRLVIEEIQTIDPSDDCGRKRHHTLSKLLEELESLKSNGSEMENSGEHNDGYGGGEKIVIEEVAKELKVVKRQNFVTHFLLSALLVITLAWQLSEVTLILSLKDGLSHPLRGLRNRFSGFLKRRGVVVSKMEEDEQVGDGGLSVDDVSTQKSDLTFPF